VECIGVRASFFLESPLLSVSMPAGQCVNKVDSLSADCGICSQLDFETLRCKMPRQRRAFLHSFEKFWRKDLESVGYSGNNLDDAGPAVSIAAPFECRFILSPPVQNKQERVMRV